jgi:hypothetical protein
MMCFDFFTVFCLGIKNLNYEKTHFMLPRSLSGLMRA